MSRVALLKGGRSLERGVSLRSAARVADALERLGHDCCEIDIGADLVARLRDCAPDVAFLALHGGEGEDGTVQELLEVLGIPYTGPGVAACVRCADKTLAKRHFVESAIPTPDFLSLHETAVRELGAGAALPDIAQRLQFPIVVKPANQGSALGIRFARAPADVPPALVAAFSYDRKLLLERYIAGRELAVSVLDSPSGEAPTVLPVVEAVPRAVDFYDFEARYEIGRTTFVCPAQLPAATTERVQEIALAAYRALGCYGFARVDLLLAKDDPDSIFVLEVNAIPGLTDTSLLPQAAEAAGIGFDEVVERALACALARADQVAAAVLPA
jgi:D-alanine-D-alanine ligase